MSHLARMQTLPLPQFEERFRNGLVWTVGLTVEIKLHFKISLAKCGHCLIQHVAGTKICSRNWTFAKRECHRGKVSLHATHPHNLGVSTFKSHIVDPAANDTTYINAKLCFTYQPSLLRHLIDTVQGWWRHQCICALKQLRTLIGQLLQNWEKPDLDFPQTLTSLEGLFFLSTTETNKQA